jgi:alpha-amylase/alpha-mannosidase (GH57 family)
MAEVALALFWHQHQPYYPDDVGHENLMPWVRLHGVKDYYGMALHLLEFPEMRCTINLVPSLLAQLEAYAQKRASDLCLDMSRRPASSLSESDCLYLLDHFFMANPQHMILPYPRYAELYQRRSPGRNSARESLRRFQERDFRDLQVWFNLTWIHPLVFERDANLRGLLAKGRGFSEQEKNWLLDKHLEILAEIIPLHRKLAADGQVELTTTPYYHPILPLLFDKKLAREAMPNVKLPRYPGGYVEDAQVQLELALEKHAQVFDKPPRGMWPAEGSVCQSMIPLLAEHGIRWIATDEEILSASTQGFVSRDDRGHVRNPDQMYRPYRVAESGKELSILFRDHALSDMVGFHYQRSEGGPAAEDLMQHLRNIGQALTGPEPGLVSIILDGENCWEHFPGGGVAFLRGLYERCCRGADVKPVQIGEYLEKYPPRDTLPHLFAGSWIRHDFSIWIGHEEDNTAWDALHQAREHLRQRSQEVQLPPERIRQAWEELYIAEGSDWFWWFGDEHSSAQDTLFDYLFRKHLQNIYLLLGDAPPADLSRPISRRGQRSLYSLPRAFLSVKADGRRTFFEWLGAGRYTCQSERGTMAMGSRGPMRELYFGFDASALMIRVDFEFPARNALADFDAFRLGFAEPGGTDVQVVRPARPDQVVKVVRRGQPVSPDEPEERGPRAVALGVDHILELIVPFETLGAKAEEPLQFFVELLQGGQSRDRAPREGTINLTCPTADFEQIMWDV